MFTFANYIIVYYFCQYTCFKCSSRAVLFVFVTSRAVTFITFRQAEWTQSDLDGCDATEHLL